MARSEYFKGKRIIVTGGLSGIGKELIEQLLPSAETIYCLDSSNETPSSEAPTNPKVNYLTVDVGDRKNMVDISNKILSEGPVDIIFANAGIDGGSSALDFDLELNQKVMEINYLGVVNTVVPYLKDMLKRKEGHIVGVSSIGVYRGVYKAAPYFSAKAAMTVFLESIRLEVKSKGITISTVFPGFIKTAISCDGDLPPAFVMDSNTAVSKMLKGVAAKKSGIYFPWQMRIICFFNRNFPNWMFDYFALAALKKMSRDSL